MLFIKESDLVLREPNSVSKDLDQTIDWMANTLGINVQPTRIAFYKKYLAEKVKINSLEDYRKYILISKEVDTKSTGHPSTSHSKHVDFIAFN